MAYLKKAQHITAGTDYAVLSSRIKGNIGLALQAAQAYEAAAAQFESALEDADGQIDSGHMPYYLYYLGATDIKLGLYNSANTRLRSALADFRQRNEKVFMTLSLIGLAEVQSRLGFHQAGMAMLAQARPHIALSASARLIARYHRTAAEAYARMKDYPAAYRATMELVAAEHALALAGSKKGVQELTVKFDVKLKDGENAVLIAERAQLESRKTVLILALLFGAILLGTIAVLLVLQVRQKRRFAALALHDELTGAPNRRHIIARACAEVKAARQYGREVWLSILDIDHFKRINDECGHEAGDAVLKMFYACCAGALRQSDALGRVGGEEFLLVSVGARQDDILFLFERLLKAVKLIEVPGAPSGYALSFSMGTCSSSNPKLDVKGLIKHADDALYQAKQNGRGRCHASVTDGSDQAAR
ncbi:MAG: GGDEF domain-containing protein [Pseudomonadota bacterium]